MAANIVTSNTGTASGTDPTFLIAYRTQQSQGVVFYIKYTQGTEANITLTFDVLNTSLHATDKYRHTSLSGTDLTAFTMIIGVSGNYRIPLPVICGEMTIYANVVFSGADTGGVVVGNFMES